MGAETSFALLSIWGISEVDIPSWSGDGGGAVESLPPQARSMSLVALISTRDHVEPLTRWGHRLARASQEDLEVLVFDAEIEDEVRTVLASFSTTPPPDGGVSGTHEREASPTSTVPDGQNPVESRGGDKDNARPTWKLRVCMLDRGSPEAMVLEAIAARKASCLLLSLERRGSSPETELARSFIGSPARRF